jgi:cellulose synthase/poly-beta-1,6-N-acetylglucosamine synthase-like glycosyltransferase/peptidoglycan/xylan/chitin deacetylase (PgdA/CDA1 family)/spore germination protein YaaH
MFVRSLFVIEKFQLPPSIQQLKERLKVLQKSELLSAKKSPKPIWLEFSRTKQPDKSQVTSSLESKTVTESSPPIASPALQPPIVARPKTLCLGFFDNSDANSLSSLQVHARQLTHVCPEWFFMEDGNGTLLTKPDLVVQGIAKKNGIVLLPLLTNLLDDNWQPEAVEGVANGPDARRTHFIENLTTQLVNIEAGGVVIDWGQVDPTYKDTVTRLILEIAAALHAQNLELWLRIPMGHELILYDLESLSPAVDHFIATLHDENSDTDPPGPIASQDWFEGWLDTVTSYGKPSQWIVELGSYGYDWANGGRKAETISFADVMTRAGRAGVSIDRVEMPVYNPGFSYSDADTEHTVWFLDVATFINQLKAAGKLEIGGLAIYALGSEDPAIWQVIGREPFAINEEILHKINNINSIAVTQVGSGEFLTIEDTRTDGSRAFLLDESDQLTETYNELPSYLTVCHQGNGKDDEVVISFDDGPDTKWTPQILDVLQAKGIKAAFFMVGMQMEDHPNLVRRIIAEGHEVGLHTYTHPNLALVSEERIRLELNATQRLLETISGRSTILFRPPYNADSRPTLPAEVLPLKIVQEMGYLTVAEDIDPEDWEKPTVEEILERIKLARLEGGKIILLHDAGGDRTQTLAALPAIIDYLANRGDQIVSLGRLLGESPEVLMPIVKKNQNMMSRLVSSSGFRAFHFIETFLWAFMIVATILVVLRTLAVSVFALLQQRKSAQSPKTHFAPPLSVLIAAYNEEKVIAKTLQSVLNTSYPGEISIWIVDDGSVDETSKVVESFAAQDQRVHLLRQTNKGKALALRNGLDAVMDDIVVTLDADTQFQSDTLQKLVQPLQDPRVGAVSGHAKVGNLRKFIARCQSLEYICGFNLDRQAYHYLNCITVVPGAISALRKSAVVRAGGISTDTLAEDTDLTISLHRQGYLISYVAGALAFTEVPETVAGLAKQRFRWGFGTIQCLWKHRDMVLNPHFKALGCFSLPGIWFFQVLLVAVAPIIDLMVIFSLMLGWSSPALYAYFAVFLLMDILLAALACLMEHEPLRQAWLALPMRFLYRPMLSWVIWKSLSKAAKGVLVSWGKLERTASVNH